MDRQAQIWKIFQKHQTIPDDIQDLHFHLDDFKNGIEKEFVFLKEATQKTDILCISMLTCEQYI